MTYYKEQVSLLEVGTVIQDSSRQVFKNLLALSKTECRARRALELESIAILKIGKYAWYSI